MSHGQVVGPADGPKELSKKAYLPTNLNIQDNHREKLHSSVSIEYIIEECFQVRMSSFEK